MVRFVIGLVGVREAREAFIHELYGLAEKRDRRVSVLTPGSILMEGSLLFAASRENVRAFLNSALGPKATFRTECHRAIQENGGGVVVVNGVNRLFQVEEIAKLDDRFVAHVVGADGRNGRLDPRKLMNACDRLGCSYAAIRWDPLRPDELSKELGRLQVP